MSDESPLSQPPFRSIYFLLTTLMGLGCVVLDWYILHRFRVFLVTWQVAALITLVGTQVLYQAIRLLTLVPMIQEFYSIASPRNLAPDSPLGGAIGATVTRFVDQLFFSYGITLGALGVLARVLAVFHPR